MALLSISWLNTLAFNKWNNDLNRPLKQARDKSASFRRLTGVTTLSRELTCLDWVMACKVIKYKTYWTNQGSYCFFGENYFISALIASNSTSVKFLINIIFLLLDIRNVWYLVAWVLWIDLLHSVICTVISVILSLQFALV